MSDDYSDKFLLNQKAWVVFSGRTDIGWLKILKPGFRHCYVLLNDGKRWASIDPLSHLTEVAIHHHVPINFDLPGWLEQQGQTVLSTPICRDLKKPAPFMIFTCVEAVKRLIGVHKRLIYTPWQLYKHLKQVKSFQFETV